MEIWDLCDGNRKPLNRTHVRGVELGENEYHTVVSIIVVNDNKELLITKRDLRKDFGGLWEVTAGSILAGETSKQGAIRELKEETGIIINEEDVNLLGTLKEESCFTDIYITKYNFDINKITLQEGETIDVKKVTLDKLYEMIENNEVPLPNVERIEHVKDNIEEFINKI